MKATLKPFPFGVGEVRLGPFQYRRKERVAVYALRVKCFLVCSIQSNSNLPTQGARSFVMAVRLGHEPNPSNQCKASLASLRVSDLRGNGRVSIDTIDTIKGSGSVYFGTQLQYLVYDR